SGFDPEFGSPILARLRAQPGMRGTKAEARLRPLIEQHFGGLWTFCRRLGLAEGDIDDAMQETTLIMLERLGDIAEGCERSFLFGTAFRVASKLRRKRMSRQEIGDGVLSEREDPKPGPEVLLDKYRAREVLDQMLSTMSNEQRLVFVL